MSPDRHLRLEDQPIVLHDDDGGWRSNGNNGTGFLGLRGTAFGARLYARLISGQLSVDQVAARQRGSALNRVELSDFRATRHGPTPAAEHRREGHQVIPAKVAHASHETRVRGYGRFDYFIHIPEMRIPEREFIEG